MTSSTRATRVMIAVVDTIHHHASDQVTFAEADRFRKTVLPIGYVLGPFSESRRPRPWWIWWI